MLLAKIGQAGVTARLEPTFAETSDDEFVGDLYGCVARGKVGTK